MRRQLDAPDPRRQVDPPVALVEALHGAGQRPRCSVAEVADEALAHARGGLAEGGRHGDLGHHDLDGSEKERRQLGQRWVVDERVVLAGGST